MIIISQPVSQSVSQSGRQLKSCDTGRRQGFSIQGEKKERKKVALS